MSGVFFSGEAVEQSTCVLSGETRSLIVLWCTSHWWRIIHESYVHMFSGEQNCIVMIVQKFDCRNSTIFTNLGTISTSLNFISKQSGLIGNLFSRLFFFKGQLLSFNAFTQTSCYYFNILTNRSSINCLQKTHEFRQIFAGVNYYLRSLFIRKIAFLNLMYRTECQGEKGEGRRMVDLG